MATDIEALLDEISERADAATPGPWRVCGEGSEGSRWAPAWGDKRNQTRFIGICNGRVQPEDGRNARFVAAARTDVPRLVAMGTAVQDFIAHMDAEAQHRGARIACREVAEHLRQLMTEALTGGEPDGD